LGRDPDPDERNDCFDFSLFFWRKSIVYRLTMPVYFSHRSELNGKFQVNTNHWVAIRIPTNVTIILTFHSFFRIIFSESRLTVLVLIFLEVIDSENSNIWYWFGSHRHDPDHDDVNDYYSFFSHYTTHSAGTYLFRSDWLGKFEYLVVIRTRHHAMSWSWSRWC